MPSVPVVVEVLNPRRHAEPRGRGAGAGPRLRNARRAGAGAGRPLVGMGVPGWERYLLYAVVVTIEERVPVAPSQGEPSRAARNGAPSLGVLLAGAPPVRFRAAGDLGSGRTIH